MKSIGDRLKRFHLKGSAVIQLFAIGGSLCLFGASQNATATNYFNWGVETLKVDYGVNGPGQYTVEAFSGTTRDCTVAHTGSCSSKMVVIGNDGGNQTKGWDTIQWNPAYPWNFVGSPPLYYRWWMKIQPGFSWGTNEKKTKSSRVVMTNSANRGYTGYVWAGGFRLSECDGTGGCTTPGGGYNNDYQGIDYDMTTKADGVWHEYIVMVKPNSTATTPDALFKAWVDGVEVPNSPWNIGGVTGFILHSTASDKFTDGWGGWMATSYFQLNTASGAGGTIYVDDFSTDDSYNSLIGGGTTPLSPPTGLSIQ